MPIVYWEGREGLTEEVTSQQRSKEETAMWLSGGGLVRKERTPSASALSGESAWRVQEE